jgi:hypothetical protein
MPAMGRDTQTANAAVDAAALTTACADVAAALADVRNLLPEPQGKPRSGTIGRHAPESSEPWQGEAASVYWTIHFGARRLEDACRADVGLPSLDPPRGGSTGNTDEALTRIANYGPTLTTRMLAEATRRVDRWVSAIGQLSDIDQADVWVPVPRTPGSLPPACPYCTMFSLRMTVLREIVRCFNPACRDGDGTKPVARMERGRLTGDGMLVFTDGSVIHYRAEAAETT